MKRNFLTFKEIPLIESENLYFSEKHFYYDIFKNRTSLAKHQDIMYPRLRGLPYLVGIVSFCESNTSECQLGSTYNLSSIRFQLKKVWTSLF